MNTNPASSDTQPALLFIPDISGFTRFVTDTEISHSKHIIEELLEIIMASNKIDLEVSEIEGDAILFYRFGKAPSASEILDQVREMFYGFHTHLKKYEKQRICNCGACCTAANLELKFVAHFGDIAVNTIRQHKKLFGKDVIVAHRLLKNEIDSSQYSLFTEALVQADESWKQLEANAWSDINKAEQEYDSGKITFHYLSLHPLMNTLPEPPVENFSLPGHQTKVLEVEDVIEAPLDFLFNIIADVPFRTNWIPGTMPVFTDMNSELTQTGQTHKCIANGPIMVSHNYKIDSEEIAYTETDDNKSHCTVTQLKKLDDQKTLVRCAVFIKSNPLKALMFKLFMKKKYTKVYEASFENLKKYSAELLASGKKHPFSIVPRPTAVNEIAI